MWSPSAKERAASLTEVDARRGELHREIEVMQTHQAKQGGRVELNIGGYRFQTSVQTLRRVPHTFFDAYFSGRYAQDVCSDGSIFVDRDGENFGHVLEYMRDSHLSVAEAGARPSVSLLRALKREFGFYYATVAVGSDIYVLGGNLAGANVFAACTEASHATVAVGSDIYVLGGNLAGANDVTADVLKYNSSQGTWTQATPMPQRKFKHASCAIGSDIYVFGGSSCGGRVEPSVFKFGIYHIWHVDHPGTYACCLFFLQRDCFGRLGVHLWRWEEQWRLVL
jgi:hypothetical protein